MIYLFNKYSLSLVPIMSRNQNSPQSQEILNPVKEADGFVTKAEKMAMKESIAVPKKPRTKATEG